MNGDQIRHQLMGWAKDNFLPRDVLLISELSILYGRARIDLAALGEKFYGFEIKSNSDTLSRLPRQKYMYHKVFDYITLVVGKKHATSARRSVPPFWGIILFDEDKAESFKVIREPQLNRDTDYLSICSLLWKSEVLEIARQEFNVHISASCRKDVIYQKLSSYADHGLLRSLVRSRLSKRTNWLAAQ